MSERFRCLVGVLCVAACAGSQQKPPTAAPVTANVPKVAVPSIRYRVVTAPGTEGEEQGTGLLAERDGKTFVVMPTKAGACLVVHRERDLDGDGLLDALIVDDCGGNCCPGNYFFVAGTQGEKFAAQELATDWEPVELENWKGRPSLVLVTNNEGMNTRRAEKVTQRFIFERGRAVVVEEQRAVEQKALVDLRAEQFEGAEMDEERSVSFDLDRDGRKDVLAGTLWDRWGRIWWHVRFANGHIVSDDRRHACKRLGVLTEVTQGYHDLVCDFDTRLRWNGERYVDGNGE